MYYMVTAKCGHVGVKKYININFAVIANTAKEAAQKILNRSKVKKHLKNAISSVNEINYADYLKLREKMNNDSYLKAHSSREYDLSKYDIHELDRYIRKNSFTDRNERVMYLLKKNKTRLEEVKDEYVY